MWGPAAGGWSLTATNQTQGDTGVVRASVAYNVAGRPDLPPAAVGHLDQIQCDAFSCHFTLSGLVSTAAASKVQQLQWFDGHGNPENNGNNVGNTITITTGANPSPFEVILKTIGTGGYRVTAFTVTCSGC